MKKLYDWLDEKRISYVLMIIFLLSLVPIVELGFYNYPCADDFSASDTAYWAWNATGSLWEVVKAAWENVVYNYYQWSGVFVSVFWTSLQPGLFGEQFYGFTTLIAVVLFVLGGAYLGHVVFEKYLKVDKYTAGGIVMLYLFTSIQCMPDGNEGLYWHAGVANYTWTFAFLLLLLGLVLSVYQEENRGKKIVKGLLACLLGIFVGGGNYLTALQGSLYFILISVIGCFWLMRTKKTELTAACKKCIWIFLPTVVLLISFAASVLAPGNKVRMSSFAGLSPVKAVLVSFYYFLEAPVEEWLTWPVLVLLAIAIPFMWHMAGKTRFSYAYPGIVVLSAFCMVSAAFTPNLYAQGDVGGGRLADTIYFIWILWLYVVTCYLTGWIRKQVWKTGDSEKEVLSERSKIYIIGMVSFWLVCSALAVMIDEDTYICTSAESALSTGQAQQFREENEIRLKLLKEEDVEHVVLPGFSNPPKLLIFNDITYDEKDWLNQAVAEYYGKRSVRRE